MTANELRIGNWVIETKIGNPVYIRGGGIQMFEENRITLEPIPLTEEWLLKFGFKKASPSENNYDNNSAYEIESWGKVALRSGVLVSDEWYFLDGMTSEIKYVHQLQNLYFALTGQELEVK